MKLPRDLSGRDVVKALSKVGFQVYHRKGSHIYLRREEITEAGKGGGEAGRFIAVPDHPAIAVGTLRAIIREAGLEREEFLKLL